MCLAAGVVTTGGLPVVTGFVVPPVLGLVVAPPVVGLPVVGLTVVPPVVGLPVVPLTVVPFTVVPLTVVGFTVDGPGVVVTAGLVGPVTVVPAAVVVTGPGAHNTSILPLVAVISAEHAGCPFFASGSFFMRSLTTVNRRESSRLFLTNKILRVFTSNSNSAVFGLKLSNITANEKGMIIFSYQGKKSPVRFRIEYFESRITLFDRK